MDFHNRYSSLPSAFHELVSPTAVTSPALIWKNRTLGAELALESDWFDSAMALDVFSGNSVLPDSNPLAMAYAGHQFGHFVPQLGDGRAILLGELADQDGQLHEVQLKGAGVTPFSRQGDGRAAIGPVIRETILSEAMHVLGVPSTRVLAALGTGESVHRERILPGGIVVRVAKSHVRIGTFEYFAARKDRDSLKALIDFVLAHFYTDLNPINWAVPAESKTDLLAFFDAVMARQIHLVTKWMGIGFIHGVMNTDNVSIIGDTIDYGPAAFLDEFHPGKVFSYIDQNGRYAYGNQAAVMRWNLGVLGHCLSAVFEESDEQGAFGDEIDSRLGDFWGGFADQWRGEMGKKLGISNPNDADVDLVNGFLDILREYGADYTLSFRALYDVYVQGGGMLDRVGDNGVSRGDESFAEAIDQWQAVWLARLNEQGDEAEVVSARLREVNPYIIPRNHQIERVIQSAESGDYGPFERMMAACADPYETRGEFKDYATAPLKSERIQNTFCGT